MVKQTLIAIGMMTVASAAFAGQAQTDQAQTETDPTANVVFEQSFADLDINGNGKISWSEAEKNGISHSAFLSAETTHDKALNKGEYRAAKEARGGVVGEAVEAGKDTETGMEPPIRETYNAMDANSDGRISKSEFQKYYASSGLYDRWDVNNDGTIDEQEFVDVLYIYYDDNDDGYIDDAEWEDGVMIDDYGDNGLWDY